MTFYEYQVLAETTARKDLQRRDLATMCAMGLAGEAGETVDYLKKVLFHNKEFSKETLVGELGDVLWYVATLAGAVGLNLDDVATYNVLKLKARYPDGFRPLGAPAAKEAANAEKA